MRHRATRILSIFALAVALLCALAAAALASSGGTAYVTNQGSDTVSQYTIDATTGALTPKQPPSVAAPAQPLHLAATPDGRNLYVTTGSGGSVAQYTIDPVSGALSPKSPFTVAAPAFSQGAISTSDIAVSPNGTSAYVGAASSDTVATLQYSVAASGALSPKNPGWVNGGGNGFLAITPDGKNLYVTDGYDFVIWQFTVDPTSGKLTPK